MVKRFTTFPVITIDIIFQFIYKCYRMGNLKKVLFGETFYQRQLKEES